MGRAEEVQDDPIFQAIGNPVVCAVTLRTNQEHRSVFGCSAFFQRWVLVAVARFVVSGSHRLVERFVTSLTPEERRAGFAALRDRFNDRVPGSQN